MTRRHYKRFSHGWNGANWRPVALDRSTRASSTIEYEHHEIHAGSAYACSYTQTVSDTNDRSIITFRTPDTLKYCHFTIAAASSEPAVVIFTEGPTVTNNTGATLTVYNRNRTSTNTTGVWDTSQNPDVQGQATYFTETTMGNVTGGDILEEESLSAGSGNRAVGGSTRGTQEWVLAPNTLYAVEIKSTTNDTNTHFLQLDWYEHTDKDA